MQHATTCFNLKYVVNWPARVTNSCTIIDQIFINFYNDGLCYVLDHIISDHRSFLFLEISNRDIKSHCNKYYRRSFTECNIFNFQSKLNDVDWSCLYNLKDFYEAFMYFYETSLYLFSIYFPKHKAYTTNLTKVNISWTCIG